MLENIAVFAARFQGQYEISPPETEVSGGLHVQTRCVATAVCCVSQFLFFQTIELGVVCGADVDGPCGGDGVGCAWDNGPRRAGAEG